MVVDLAFCILGLKNLIKMLLKPELAVRFLSPVRFLWKVCEAKEPLFF
jgi:hypothetical protein